MTPRQLRDAACTHPRPTIHVDVRKNGLLSGKTKVTCPRCKKVLYDDTKTVQRHG